MYYIDNIVVDESWRRKVIAKRLYETLVDQAKTEGVNAIELTVWAFNEPAIHFYKSLGMSVKNMRFEQLLDK